MDRPLQLALPRRVNLPLGARSSCWAPPAALALVSALAAQSWFRLGTVVAGGDNTPAGFLDPGGALSAARWIWSTSSTPTGAVDYSATLGAFPALLAGPLALIGIGPAGAQRIFLTLLFASLAPAMFLLLRTLLPRREHLPAVVAGSAFYAFNAGLFFSIPNVVILTSLVLLPLLPALIIRGSRSAGWRDPALLAATAIPLGYAFQNPPAATLVLAASLAAAVAGLVAGPRRSSTVFLLRSALLGGLVAAWWLVPVALTLLGPSHPTVTSAADPFAWSWTHRRASLGNVLRLTPSWAWPRREYFPYGTVLERDVFLPLVYLPAALTFAAPIVHRRRRRLALAVAAGAVVAAFLAKGLHPPLSGLNAALYRHVPGMWLFREPSAKFTLLLAGLFAIGIALFVGAFARTAVRWTVVGVVVAATAATTFPIWLGKVVPDTRPLLPSAHVRIPAYWYSAARFIDANPGRTLLLPADGYYQVPYTWGFYGADLIPEQLIHSPVVRLMDKQSYGYLTPDAGAYRLLAELRQALAGARFRDAAQLMDVLSIHWIVLRRDVDSSFPGRKLQDPATLAAGFAASDKLRLVRTFGRLDLYQLRAREHPLVWAPSHVLVGSSSALAAVAGGAAVVDGGVSDGAADGMAGRHLFEVGFDTWHWAGSRATVQLRPQPGLYEGLVRWPRGIPLDIAVRTGITGPALEIRAPEVSVGGRALAPTLTRAVLPLQGSQPQLFSIDGRIVPLSTRAETSISVGTGRHRIAVFAPGEPLPVHDASFERGTWGVVGVCS
jgi:arabinofuranan 3-O-arabinosyltransferase